jgi:hypothetical protein
MPFLVFLLVVVSTAMLHAESNLTGRWEGVVDVPGSPLKVIVDLAVGDGAASTGSITIPGLGLKGAELSDIVRRDSDAAFAIKEALSSQSAGHATFKAQLKPDGKMSGTFTQAGNTAPFAFEKTGPAQVELPPRSTAVAKEAEGEWKGDYEMLGYARHVTLKLKNQNGGAAAAELVIVGKRVNNLPVDLVIQDGELLTIQSHQSGIGYEGRLGKGGAEMTGTITQGPLEAPITLKHSP